MAFGEIYKYTWWGQVVTGGFGYIYQSLLNAANGIILRLIDRADAFENEVASEQILTPLDSFLDKASIFLTPTAYSDGIIHTALPENGDGDFDFTRATTATRVNSSGVIESVAAGEPRIDYSSGVGQWLFEPARTNLIRYTEDFSNAAWIKTNLSLSASTEISPDGTQNAYDITSIGSGQNFIRFTEATSGIKSYSIFAKSSEGYLQIVDSGSTNLFANFDLINGVVGTKGANVTSKIRNYGNGWYKCSMSSDGTQTSAQCRFYIVDSSTSAYASSSTRTDTISIYGAQLEAGSYSTSYIPNDGVTATKTRNADIANNSGNADLFNDSEGVLYAEIAALANDGTNRRISISDGSTDDKVELFYSTSNTIKGDCYTGGASQAPLDFTLGSALTLAKCAYKFKANDFALWVNGFEMVTDTSGSIPTGLNTLGFDDGAGADDFYGKTKELGVFIEALTDAQLETLTSWASFELMAADLNYV